MPEKYPGSLMTDRAIAHDESLGLPLYRLDEVYCDHFFNCRLDQANQVDSMDLAISIRESGLLQPIIIRPCGEQPTDPEDYKYMLVAGFRRYQAYRVNQHPVIPAVLVQNQSELENRSTNLIENLKRKNLNLLEEAKAIQPFIEAGLNRDQVAAKLGMSPGWVQIRTMILELTPEVQEEFAAGNFTTTHVRELNSLKNDREKQLMLAKKIKEARLRNAKNSEIEKIINQNQKPKPFAKKRRTVGEVEQMIEHISQHLGFSLATRALAWSAGNISNYDLFQDIREECQDQGRPYTMPELEI